jgi:hypothetical protein
MQAKASVSSSLVGQDACLEAKRVWIESLTASSKDGQRWRGLQVWNREDRRFQTPNVPCSLLVTMQSLHRPFRSARLKKKTSSVTCSWSGRSVDQKAQDVHAVTEHLAGPGSCRNRTVSLKFLQNSCHQVLEPIPYQL